MSEPVAVALSRDVPANTSIGVRVDDIEYVVWRDAKGRVHIWDDRCPHRGMKMSLGFVRADGIACLYHGWEYGPDGKCRKIPAHPDLEVPSSIAIGTHRAAERIGLIWLARDGAPDWPHERPMLPVRSLMIEASVVQVDTPDGVHAALQPVGENLTMVHIVAEPGTDLVATAHWAQTLRTALECVT